MTEDEVFITGASVPYEFISFFGKATGASLLVKGLAGTGKTTFALEMLETLSKFENGYYLSTRVSNEVLYHHYPWLRDRELRAREREIPSIVEERKEIEFISPGDYFPKEKFMYAGIRRLEEERSQEKIESEEARRMTYRFETPYLDKLGRAANIPEIDAIYRRVERNMPRKSFFVIDSLRGLTSKYHMEPEEIVTCLQKDLVEKNLADLLIVLEEEGASIIDFQVDGVVVLKSLEEDGRRYRLIHLQKLRGEEIKQPDYLLTLHGGRFRSFTPFRPLVLRGNLVWRPLRDSATHFSTGCLELDDLLEGGYPRGSNVLIEIGHGIPNDAHRLFTISIIANFITQDRGVIVTPFAGTSLEEISRIAKVFGIDERLMSRLKVTEYAASMNERSPSVIPLNFEDINDDIKLYNIAREELRGTTDAPILEVIGAETIVARYGEANYERVLNISAEITKRHGDLTIRLTSPGMENLTKKISSISDIHMVLIERHGNVLMFGVKPKTQYFNVDWSFENRMISLRLTPIV